MTHGQEGEFPCAFTMINGPMLELWLLKVLWGALETRSVRMHSEVASYRFRLGVSTSVLADILWRGQEWPRKWGLYVPTAPMNGPMRLKSTSIRFVNAGPEILGGGVNIAGLDYLLGFERPDVPVIYQPAALTFQRKGYRNWKMAALAWPEVGHDPINVVSQRERGEDWYTPPTDTTPRIVDLGQFRR